MRGEDYTREYDDLGFVGDLSQPFPHSAAWNPPESSLDEPVPPPDATPEEKERLVEEWRCAMDDTFGNMSYVNGAIAIGTKGCGQVMWLVVNGPQKGYVWDDSISDGLGLFPLCDASGRPMTFTEWFLSELRSARCHH